MSDGLTDKRSLTEEQVAYNQGMQPRPDLEHTANLRKLIDTGNNAWVKAYTDEQLKSIIKAAKGELVHRMKEL